MSNLGLLGGLAQGLEKGLSTYRDETRYQQDRALKERLAKVQEAEAAAKLADVIGTVPAGLFSPETRSLFTKDKPQSFSYQTNQTNPSNPDQPNKKISQDSSQKPSSSDLSPSPSTPPNTGLIQGGSGFLTRPIDTDIMPKHVREGIKEATQLSAQNYGKGVIYKYDPDQRIVVQQSAPRSAEHELDLTHKTLENKVAEQNLSKIPEQQGQAALYGKRMLQAEEVFKNLESQGYDRTELGQGAASILPGALQPGKFKEQDQAERNFVNAVLRRESGAAIAKSEFDSAEKQYFPRPGDPPEVLAQKKANRELAIAGMRQQAGDKAWAGLSLPRVAVNPKKSGGQGMLGSSDAQAAQKAPAAPAPKPGMSQDGYIFLGGDPANPKSWRKH